MHLGEPVNHSHGDFSLAHDDGIGAVLFQLVDFSVRMGAGDDQRSTGSRCGRTRQRGTLRRHSGWQSPGCARREDWRDRSTSRGAGIAENRLNALPSKLFDPLFGILDDQERRARRLKVLTDDAADAAVADEDGVAGKRRRLDFVFGFSGLDGFLCGSGCIDWSLLPPRTVETAGACGRRRRRAAG